MKRRQPTKFWRVNENIRSSELRVIDSDGKQVGILSRNEALERARKKELDLVEIAPQARPPVAKLIEFVKFKYEQDKKEREERRREKKGAILKEVWFTPLIAQGDYNVRLSRVEEFLEEGAKVRIIVKPKRRLDNAKPLYRVLEKVIKDIAEHARVEQPPRMFGRQLATLVAPAKGQKNEENKENEIENKKVGTPPVQDNGNGGDSARPKLQGTSGGEQVTPSSDEEKN